MENFRWLTVSALTDRIRQTLEHGFAEVAVEGEISNLRPSSTGHLYFTLKDGGAAISAVMFKNRLRTLDFVPADGQLVHAAGALSVYAQRGSYQIVCEALEAAGSGDLLAVLEERKRLLAAEGLFDQARKKAIPRFPASVGVVSSPTGAAVRDILNVLSRRAAGIRVVILPTQVQGPEAAPAIKRRIEQANRWRLADVLIIGRGGGSLEDLLPFSDEGVVRAVAASEIPVISAVGHEIDWALSDYAADLRAPTPSAAAELVSANRTETRERIREVSAALLRELAGKIERARLLARPFDPQDLEYRFRSILQPRLVRFDDAKEGLLAALAERVDHGRQRLALARATLAGASPLAILERGYSLVTNAATGRLIRGAADAPAGTLLSIRPLEGRILARSETVQEEA